MKSDPFAVIEQDPQLRQIFESWGIDPAHARQMKDAGLPLLRAAQAIKAGQTKDALAQLREAVRAAPDLATDVAAVATGKLAARLPDAGPGGIAKALLTDKPLIRRVLADEDTAEALSQLAAGDLAGLSTLVQDDSIAQAALDALAANPGFQQLLAKLGLEPEDVKRGAKLLPDLVGAGLAAAEGDLDAALQQLSDAAGKDPALVAKAVNALAGRLPDAAGLAKQLLADPALVTAIVQDEASRAAIGDLAQGRVGEALRALGKNSAARRAATDVALKNETVKSWLGKLGISADRLRSNGELLPVVLGAISSAAQGDLTGALRQLYEGATQSPGILAKPIVALASKLPSTGPAGVLRSVFTNQQAVEALIADRSAHAAALRLLAGDLGALADLAETPGVGAVAQAALGNEGVQKAIRALGLEPADVRQAGPALPDLLRAATAFQKGDYATGVRSLTAAGRKLAPIVAARIMSAAAAKLPADGVAGVIKSLMGDRAFVDQLFRNPAVGAAFEKILGGNPLGGFKDAMRDPAFRAAAANALANNDALMRHLRPFGIETGRDIAEVGGGVLDLVDASEALLQGDVQQMLRALGAGVNELSPELRARMLGKFAQTVGLPSWATELMLATGEMMGNEAVFKPLGSAMEALRADDIEGFLVGMAETGRQLSATAPDAAKAFLNSMGKIPGLASRLFADPTLNANVVDSGSMRELMDVVEELGHGNMRSAMRQLTEASAALLRQGQPAIANGRQLPISQQGIANAGRLAYRFYEMLPTETKAEVAELVAKEARRLGVRSLPLIGNVISGVAAIYSAQDLWNTYNDPKSDSLDLLLAAGQFGIDIAGTVPGLNAFTGPAGLALQLFKMAKGGMDLVHGFGDYQKALVEMNAPATKQRIPVLAKNAARPIPRSSEGWMAFGAPVSETLALRAA